MCVARPATAYLVAYTSLFVKASLIRNDAIFITLYDESLCFAFYLVIRGRFRLGLHKLREKIKLPAGCCEHLADSILLVCFNIKITSQDHARISVCKTSIIS